MITDPIVLVGRSLIASPEIVLTNRIIKAWVLLPDAVHGYYRGPRFDGSGIVRRVEYQDHVYFDRLLRPDMPVGDPKNHESGAIGTASEFGLDIPPLGYDEAKPDGSFLKIGVGELQRIDREPYGFWKPYPHVKPGKWHMSRRPVTGAAQQICFRQEVIGPRYWSYDYETVVGLPYPDRPEVHISRRLHNSGKKMIRTEHYVHNFMGIDQTPIGPDYRLEFPFASVATHPFDPVVVDLRVVSSAKRETIIRFHNTPQVDIYGELGSIPKSASGNAAVLVNEATGAGIRVAGDHGPSTIHIWGTSRVLCPELFVPIVLAPGQTMNWSIRYIFEADSPSLRASKLG